MIQSSHTRGMSTPNRMAGPRVWSTAPEDSPRASASRRPWASADGLRGAQRLPPDREAAQGRRAAPVPRAGPADPAGPRPPRHAAQPTAPAIVGAGPTRPRASSLVLLDGSPARWLEDQGPRLTLHGALDDGYALEPFSQMQYCQTASSEEGV
jgi:hypothetical protein